MKLTKKRRNDQRAGHFVLAGLFLGMGLGFLYDKLTVGIFLGLGFGFLFSAVSQVLKKNK